MSTTLDSLKALIAAKNIKAEPKSVTAHGSMMMSSSMPQGVMSSFAPMSLNIAPGPRATKVSELFTDEEAATIMLVAEILEQREMAAPEHIARMRKVATTIRVLLAGTPR